jgi:hypothetical protein
LSPQLAASAEAPCTLVCTRLDGGRINLLFANASFSHGLDETIDEVTTEEFIRVMVTPTLNPMRVT